MKTKQIVWIITAIFIVGAVFFAGTIRSNAQTSKVIEKKIGNTVYELGSSDPIYTIENKANKIKHVVGPVVTLDNSEQAGNAWKEHFKPLFSKERAKELNFRITLSCTCDSTGQVKEVRISIYKRANFEMLTLKEIKAIEDAAKNYKFNFLSWCSYGGVKHIVISYPFNPYLLYFDKPKKDN